MSTKKQLRAERRRKAAEEKMSRSKFNPAVVFILSIAALLLVVGLISHFTGGGREAPWPGAVWSPEHQHWH